MQRMKQVAVVLTLFLFLGLFPEIQAAEKKVKVFILAGQSNMEGHGQIRSLPVLGEHPKHGHLLKMLRNKDGSWVVRDDVTIAWKAKAAMTPCTGRAGSTCSSWTSIATTIPTTS